MFCTDLEIRESVFAAVSKEEGDLPAHWNTVIADANVAAYDQIVQHFAGMGYTQGQIDAWPRGRTFQKFLARYQALIDGEGGRTEVGEWRAELDYWRQKLKDIETIDAATAAATDLFEIHTRGW